VNLSDYLASYYELSGKASDVARQLAFAGIALIWIFHPAGPDPVALPHPLLLPAGCFVLGLGFDLLQYAMGSLIWGAFHRHWEQRLGPGSKRSLSAPAYLNWPGICLFWSKLALVLLGYGLLFAYILSMV
jgi:hypothetical protein